MNKSWVSSVSEVFFEKNISKFLEYLEKKYTPRRSITVKLHQQGYCNHSPRYFEKVYEKQFPVQETPLSNCFSSLQVKQICQWWVCDLFFLLILTEAQLLRNSKKQIACRQAIQGSIKKSVAKIYCYSFLSSLALCTAVLCYYTTL